MEELLTPLRLTDDDYRRVMKAMNASIEEGLNLETNPDADLKMYNTYVRSLPDGKGSLAWMNQLQPIGL